METDEPIRVVPPCGCGLDIPKRPVQACLLRATPGGRGQQEQRTCAPMTADLRALRDWLGAAGCTQVALAATGVYWKPLDNLLEGHVALLVVNAQHSKPVPGRKTDVNDAAWSARLLRHGLLRPRCVPARA